MADTRATIRLNAIDDGMISTVNNASLAFTGLTIGTTALAAGFGGLSKITASSAGQFVLGAASASKLSIALGGLADANNNAVKGFSFLADATFIAGQLGIAAKGVQDAISAYSNIPQTLALINASGVSTRSIEEFNLLGEAVRGNQLAVEQFATDAVAQLGRFEQAAARAGTILRSSTNFDDFGNAQRADKSEQIANAFEVQNLVNKSLKNTVSSTDALLGQYEVLSGGFVKAADSQQVLDAGLKLVGIGQAGGQITDTGETLRLITKTLRAYELGANDAAKTGAVLNAVVENGITTIPELSQNFGQAGQSAKAAGVSISDLGASTAVLTSQGIGTAQALTGLQRLFSNIITKTPEAEKELAKLSFEGGKIRFDVAEIQAKGFTQALLDLNTAASGNAATLQSILPEDLAFRTVLGLLAKDGQELAKVSASIGATTAKSLDEVFEIATGDRVNRLAQIANRFQEIIIKVAQSIAPVFEPGLNTLEAIANSFNALPDPVKSAIGQFIAFQITSRATTSAISILFQTILSLVGSYLQVRVVSLLLTGQLGKEIGVIRDLITQRKGLGAATLQLFGIDQRYRLGTEAATTAMQKQGVVARSLANIRTSAGRVVTAIAPKISNEIVPAIKSGAVAAGQSVVTVGKQAVQATGQIALGAAEAAGVVPTPVILDSRGNPLNSTTGKARVGAAFRDLGASAGSAADNIRVQIAQAGQLTPSELERNIRTASINARRTARQIRFQTQNEVDGIASNGSDNLNDPATRDQATSDRRNTLVNRDIEVKKASAAATLATEKATVATTKTTAINSTVTRLATDLEIRRNAAITAQSRSLAVHSTLTSTQAAKENVLNDVKRTQLALTRTESALDKARVQQQSALTVATAAQNKQDAAAVALAQARINAEARYATLAALTTEARVAQAVATDAQALATAALSQAELLEQKRAGSPAALTARANATFLQTQATNLRTIATTQATGVEALYRATALASELAERGLAQARIFGTTVTFTTTGIIGALNKVLATEITLKGTSAIATKALAAVQTAYNFSLGIGSTAIANFSKFLRGINLANIQSGLLGLGSSIKGLATGGLANLKGGLTAMVGQFGLASLALLPLAVGLIGFGDQLFGIGAKSRDLSKDLRQVIADTEALRSELGKDAGLLNLKIQTNDLIEGVKSTSNALPTQSIKVKPEFEQGSFDATISAPGSFLGGFGNAIASPFRALGGEIDKLNKRDLTNVATPTVELQPLRDNLNRLRDSGAITSGQFSKLARTLNDVGTAGTDSTAKLEEFRREIEKVRAGDKGDEEKGVFDKIGDVIKGAPGSIFEQLRRAVNVPGAFVKETADVLTLKTNPLNATGNFFTGKSITNQITEQQADALVTPLSLINNLNKRLGDSLVETTSLSTGLSKGQFSDENLNRKFKGGETLKATDFEQSDKVIADRIKNNQSLTSGIEKAIADNKKIADSIKDPGLRASFEANVKSLEGQRLALEKGTEALKQRKEALDKYVKETVPALKRALTESSDPIKALGDAQTAFSEQFTRDADNKLTGFTKDIGTLRTEAQRYQSQIIESYETTSANVTEQETARRLREVRDNKITLEDGTKGFRLSIAERKAATEGIVSIEQEASKKRAADNDLEAEKIRVLQISKIKSSEDAEAEIGQIQINSNNEQLAQKEALIEEYKNQGFRTVELEREASALRVQIQGQEATQISKARDRLIAQFQNKFNVDIAQTKALAATRDISSDEADDRINNSQIAAARYRLQVIEGFYKIGGKKSVELEQEAAILRAGVREQEAQNIERIYLRSLERRKQSLANEATALNLVLQGQANGLNNQTKSLDLVSQLSTSRTSVIEAQSQFDENQLRNAIALTGDIEQRAKLESQIAQQRVRNLPVIQAAEQQSLANQTRLNELSLMREVISNRITKNENQRNIAQTRIDLAKARRDKKPGEEIRAVELQLAGLDQQSTVLEDQAGFLEQSQRQQQEIAANAAIELGLKQQTATQDALIEQRLANQKELQAQIEKRVQGIELAAQEAAVQGQKQVLASEAFTKQLDTQKQLLEAQKNFANGRSETLQGALSIVAQTSGLESEQKELAQSIASIKLKGLLVQLNLENRILQLNQAQQKAALEQEKIQNRVAQSANLADIAKANAEVEKLKVDPLATPEAKRAAQLGLDAKVEEGIALQFAQKGLEDRGKIQESLGRLERQQLSDKNGVVYNQARVDFAKEFLTGVQQRQAFEQIQSTVIGDAGISPDLFPGERTRLFRDFNNQFIGQTFPGVNLPGEIGDVGNFGNVAAPQLPKIDPIDYEEFRKNAIARLQEFILPELILRSSSTPTNQVAGQVTNKAKPSPTTTAESQVTKPLTLTGDLIVNNTVNVAISSPQDRQLGIEVENSTLDALGGAFKLVKQNLINK